MREEVFLDASYAIALAVRSDCRHEKAMDLATELQSRAVKLVTTRAVMLEICNALSRQRYRQAAVVLADALERDESVEILPLSDDLFREAFNLFRERADKEWGITDCTSFVVMKKRGMTSALTADEHFLQAGFRALLRE